MFYNGSIAFVVRMLRTVTVKNNACILITVLSLQFLGCHEKDGLMNYELKKLGAVIKIPDSYKPVTEKDIERIIYKKRDSGFKNDLLRMCRLNPKCEFLIDTLNPYKFIMTSEITPYFKIDSNAFYFTIDHEPSISSSSPNISDSVYYVGSKMGSFSDFKFIESKYLRKLNAYKRISYNYMISSDKKIIGIGFYSPEEQDVRRFINTIKKK